MAASGVTSVIGAHPSTFSWQNAWRESAIVGNHPHPSIAPQAPALRSPQHGMSVIRARPTQLSQGQLNIATATRTNHASMAERMSTWSYAPTPSLALASERVLALHVLRHPSCLRSNDEICGQRDVPLDAAGLADTQAIVRWWLRSGPKVQAVVSSDLLRCRDVAQALSQALGVPAFFDWRLREQAFGRWEGQRWSELTLFDAQAVAVWRNPWHSRPPEGECLADVAERVRLWWESLVRETSLTNIGVITHAGPLRVLTAGALGLATTEVMRLAPSAPSYTELSFSSSGGVVSSFGSRPWVTDASVR